MASAGWRLPVRSGTSVSPSITAPMRRGERDHGGLVHGDLDALALAGTLALDQRAQDAGAEMDAREEVADGGAGLGRRPVGWPVALVMPLIAWMVTSMAARSR